MTFEFPPDLIDLQRRWFTTEAARTAAAQSGDDAAFKDAGQRLQDLTLELQEKVREYENPYQARMALREVARAAPA